MPMDRNDKKNTPPAYRRRIPAKKPMTGLSAFFIIVVVAAALFCVVAFSMLFTSLSSGGTNVNTPQTTLPPLVTDSPSESEEISTVSALITATDTTSKRIDLYDFNIEKSYIFYIDATTKLTDKYGKQLFLAAFSEGDIVKATFAKTANVLESLQMSPEAFVKKNVTDIKVSDDIITIGNDTFNYTNKLIARHNGNSFDITSAVDVDVFTFHGYGDTIWFAELTTGHGEITVNYRPDIIDAVLEIDNDIYTAVTENISVYVSEGKHRAIFRCKNIEPFIYDFTIEHSEIIPLDISAIEISGLNLNLTVVPEDSVVTIDGVLVRHSKAVYVPFGEHLLKAEKEGYEPFEKILAIQTGAEQDITIDLIKLPDPTPTPLPQISQPNATEKTESKKMTFNTTPSEAELFIDGLYVGLTPVANIAVAYGEHVFAYRKDGYTTMSVTFNVNDTSETVINANLQPVPGSSADEPIFQ
ncbi:MAG: PEGA domain-containing protein [Clostridiales bacterium]|jgi:hypothetical protein|nr:PEGA domain-containing protein [Clostridiales bacterium]